jgi:hypothetical protein
MSEDDVIIRDLLTFVLRLTRHVPADNPAGKKLVKSALSYIQRKNLVTPLPTYETITQGKNYE